MSLELPSDCDFLGSLRFVWWESLPESQLLKLGEVGKDDENGMVSDIEGVRSLGSREMLRSIRDGISVCVAILVIVVVVVALMVSRRVVVLMVVVGIVVLVMVVRESCIGVLGLVGVLYMGALEVNCAGVVDILLFGEVFMVEVAEGV